MRGGFFGVLIMNLLLWKYEYSYFMRIDLLMVLKIIGLIEKLFFVIMLNLNFFILMSFLLKFWIINMWFF